MSVALSERLKFILKTFILIKDFVQIFQNFGFLSLYLNDEFQYCLTVSASLLLHLDQFLYPCYQVISYLLELFWTGIAGLDILGKTRKTCIVVEGLDETDVFLVVRHFLRLEVLAHLLC